MTCNNCKYWGKAGRCEKLDIMTNHWWFCSKHTFRAEKGGSASYEKGDNRGEKVARMQKRKQTKGRIRGA
jgi:hypothetical protein